MRRFLQKKMNLPSLKPYLWLLLSYPLEHQAPLEYLPFYIGQNNLTSSLNTFLTF